MTAPTRANRPGDTQGMPTVNDEPYVHDVLVADLHSRFIVHAPIREQVVADILRRKALGTERYGTPLQPHNGRSPLLDAYEEALDLAVYLRQHLMEKTSEGVRADNIAVLLRLAVRTVTDLRDHLNREGQ